MNFLGSSKACRSAQTGVCLSLALLLSPGFGSAAVLEWGVNGAGGDGLWNSANWWNGTSVQTWQNPSSAIFGGTAGIVTVGGIYPYLSAITFNTPGYFLTGTTIDAYTGNEIRVTTNANATMSLPVDSWIRKAGAGTLTYVPKGGSTISNFGVVIEEGELDASQGGQYGYLAISLRNTPGVLFTIPSSLTIRTLSGGGINGGIVRPKSTPATLRVSESGTFGGVLEDNGAALKLSLSISAGQTLTNDNFYTGTTSVGSGGVLTLSGGGSILSTSSITTTNGTIHLDNTAQAYANRISDSSPIVLTGGILKFTGNSSTDVAESVGTVRFSKQSSITTVKPGTATGKLSIKNLQREGRGTMDFQGSGIIAENLSNSGAGIVAPYFTMQNDWVTVGADGTLKAFTDYAPNINSGDSYANVKVTATSSLAASGSRATLNFQNSSAALQTLDLNSNDLTLRYGEILSSGTKGSVIQGGRISVSTDELVVINRADLSIGSSIVETGTAFSLTKHGAGILTLSGTNEYSGDTFIEQGTLVVSSDSNLGRGSKLSLNGGTLRVTGNLDSQKSLHGSGVIDAGANNVSFLGDDNAFGSFNKTGTGTLTFNKLNANSITSLGGNLNLPNAMRGVVAVQNGRLDATGQIQTLITYSEAQLEIGGNSAASLKTTGLSILSTAFTIFFDLGSESMDILEAGSGGIEFNSTSAKVNFTFRNIGGVMPGEDYLLIKTSVETDLTKVAFSTLSLSEGWAGTFLNTGEGLSVRFTSVPVPEPSAIALLGLGAGIWLIRRRVGNR